MADSEEMRDIWVTGLQYLIDLNEKKGQQHIIRDNE